MEISAIKLVRKGEHAVVEIETATGWTEVISEFADAPFSHIVEESGMQRFVTNTDKWRGTHVEAVPSEVLRQAADILERRFQSTVKDAKGKLITTKIAMDLASCGLMHHMTELLRELADTFASPVQPNNAWFNAGDERH